MQQLHNVAYCSLIYSLLFFSSVLMNLLKYFVKKKNVLKKALCFCVCVWHYFFNFYCSSVSLDAVTRFVPSNTYVTIVSVSIIILK